MATRGEGEGIAPAAEPPPFEPSHALSALLLELATLPERGAWQRGCRAGETVGRFELLREIGRGGFGIVFEARDRELGRSVAFKAVRPGSAAGQRAELLIHEAEAIARLSHPNLVTLHDVGRCEDGPYLVLELLRGETLGERIARGPLALVEALRVAVEVARGLAHAHAQGVVHRDLKPSNVYLCDGGLVKLLDFGMAHAFGRQRLLGGTPAYMAPEQWRDGVEDERTDLFALGVMLHQMLAGAVPLPEGGRTLTERPAPRLETPECPALADLVARLLRRDPADRPRSAGEVLAALTDFSDALRTGREVTQRHPLRAARGRWRARALVGGGLAVAALVAGGALLGRLPATSRGAAGATGSGGGRPPAVALLPLEVVDGTADDASLAAGLHAELITELAQIAGLRVIGRSSVQGYTPEARPGLRAVGRALGADAVLEGRLGRAGDRVRVDVRLLDASTGQTRWEERYDRRADDLFTLQTDVTIQIARALGAQLTPDEQRRVARVPTRDQVAHEQYLRALYFWGRSSETADRVRAQELLSGAVIRDPEFALAHAWLAVVDTELANDGMAGQRFTPLCAAARAHAQRAQELAPDLPQAHGALAEVRWACEQDNAGALAEYAIQVRDAPGDALARVNLGYTHMALGQWQDGIEHLRAAFALDPRSYFVAMLVIDRMVAVRRFDEALAACARAQELSPGDARAAALCAMIPFWRDGDTVPARAALDGLQSEWKASGSAVANAVDLLWVLPARTLELHREGALPDPISPSAPFIPRAALLGQAYAALGRMKEACDAFAEAVPSLEQHTAQARAAGDVPSLVVQLFWTARAHAGVGRGEEALREAREAQRLVTDVTQRAIDGVDVAEIAVVAGRPDEAVRSLGEVLASPYGLYTAAALRAVSGLAPLRGHPGFEALVADGSAGHAR